MGSDHYCLRWNNHQSNLLGVFSQLLRDESLVDVTLACSEGHSIRAHKVVLSACSSYFQTLFVDHPARHPIVILKDVRFAELSTLVEFMYHGEVNVEHCQLSELLRTAESLKVKGLTDMTNLGPPPVNLQAPTQHGNTSSASTTTTTTTTTCCKMEAPDDLAVLPPEQTEPTELLNKKPSAGSNASLTTLSTNIEGDPMVTATTTCTTTKTTLTMPTSAAPISLVSSDRKSIASDPPQSQQHQFHMQQTQHSEDQSSIKDSPTRLTTSSPHAAGGGGSSSIESDTLRAASPTSDMDDDLDESDDEEEEEAAVDDYKPSDMRLIAAESSQQRHPHHHESAVNSVVRVSDLGNAIGLVLGRLPSSAPLLAVGGSEPIAGPSNVMPPVQQVPLSLKKEVDWGGGGSADEKSNIESPSDYPRHSLDPSVADVERCFVTTSPASSTRSPRSPQHSSRSSTPATFTLGCPQHPSPGPGAAQLPSSVSIAAAVVGYHQQRHHNLATSLLEAGLVHPALFNAAAAAAAVAAAGGASAGEDLYRCGACMAAFPSIWLLEQHTALQHIGNLAAASTSSSSIDKPFVCEQCGQSYRYRSAYVKHREQNHRARLPADKLFSCDFCGMQFRYLKSFKKHRLNHALERLHGKANSETRMDMICGSGIPSGSKETTTSRGDCAPIENSSDQVSSSNETLTVIDDQPMTTSTDYPRHSYRPDNRGATDDDNDTEENPSTSGQREHIVIDSDPMQLATTSDEEHEEADDQDDTIDSVIKETSKSPALTVSGVKYAPLTAAGSSLVNVRASTSTGLATTSDLSVAIAGGSAPAASTMATVDAVEAFRSAQQASIINFLRADAAERQRERRFACPFCGKCVRSKENLKLHVRKHTGERPFVCLFCGRAFGGKSDLTRHLRIHTGERPYHCDMCGKCFARADYLSKHLTTHINAPR